MTDIDKLSSDICNACHTRHKCENQRCAMSDIVAKELYHIGYRQLTDQAIMVLRKAQRMEERIHKETAKEVAKKIKLLFYYNFDEIIPSVMESAIDKLLEEEYGVKTGEDENDENQP